MYAKRSTRNREYVPVILGCVSLVAVMQSTDLRQCRDRADFGRLNRAWFRRVFLQQSDTITKKPTRIGEQP